MSVDVAIIGAGAAGLAAANRIRDTRPALSVLVIEAADRIGGRARTIAAPGVPGAFIDLGCGWLHGARTNAWTEIAGRLGHQIDRTPAPWDSGTRRWGLSDEEAQEAVAAFRAFYGRASERDPGPVDIALSDLLEPGNRWNPLIEALGTYIGGAPLAKMSADDFARYDPGRGPDWRLPGGYGNLIAAFGAQVPVKLGTAVTLIRHGASSGLTLETTDGVLGASTVLVTVSTNVLAEEKLRFDPPLREKRDAAASLPLGLANKVFLGLASKSSIKAEAAALGSPFRRDTASYQIRPFGNDVVEAYFGGDLALEIERGSPQAALAFAADELADHFGSGIRKELSFAAMSAWAGNAHVGGSYSYAKPGGADCRSVLAAPVDSRIFFAGEACSVTRFSTAHGAYESGVAAADALIGSLR
jgi:monoamine oxidase